MSGESAEARPAQYVLEGAALHPRGCWGLQASEHWPRMVG
jgi:hypothetical protein